MDKKLDSWLLKLSLAESRLKRFQLMLRLQVKLLKESLLELSRLKDLTTLHHASRIQKLFLMMLKKQSLTLRKEMPLIPSMDLRNLQQE